MGSAYERAGFAGARHEANGRDVRPAQGQVFRPDIGSLDKAYNAWTAAEQVYRVTPIQSYLSDELEKKLGISPAPEAWKFGTTTETQLRPDQYGPEALGEYFDRLNAGEKREILDKEFEERYGMQGMYREWSG